MNEETPQVRSTEYKQRLFILVPYNVSSIQKGIQALHGAIRFSRETADRAYVDWADIDQTVIVKNGGTTNNNPDRYGTLQLHWLALQENSVPVGTFFEPDLNDALTAVVLLADERVWDTKKYPEPNTKGLAKEYADIVMERFIENIGGSQQYFLRTFLAALPLAN